MERAEKQQWINNIHEDLSATDIVIVTHYKGLTVANMTELRSIARDAGATFRVTKNRLVKLALKNTAYDALADMFTGPTAVAYANDPVAAAKIIADFSKKNDKLSIIGGAFGSKLLNTDDIQQLATLPSLDELRAKIISIIQTPATRIAGVVQAPAGQLARVFGAYAKKDA